MRTEEAVEVKRIMTERETLRYWLGRVKAGTASLEEAYLQIAARLPDDDEYVTLDSVLGRGRHEGDSGCDLGNVPT